MLLSFKYIRQTTKNGRTFSSVCLCVPVTYMCILVKKMQPIQVYSQDARCLDGGRARALDVEEGGAKHGKGADQTWAKRRVILTERTNIHIHSK